MRQSSIDAVLVKESLTSIYTRISFDFKFEQFVGSVVFSFYGSFMEKKT